MSITKSLQAYSQSMQLVSQIYYLSPAPSELSFNLQFRKTAVSIGHSISEGFGAFTYSAYLYNYSQTNALIHQLKTELKVANETGNLHFTDYLILVNSATLVQETLVQILAKIAERKNEQKIRVPLFPLNPNLKNDKFI